MAEQTRAAEQSASPEHQNSHHRIVVGVDGSPSSIEALRWAARISAAVGASIDAVTVAERHSSLYGYAVNSDAISVEDPDAHRLEEAVSRAFGEDRPDGMRLIVRDGGSPAKVLLNASRDAEMLVVGCRGHNAMAGRLVGSVSAACAEGATCPVLVVHSDHVHAAA